MAKGKKKGSHANSKAAKIRALLAEGLPVHEIAAKAKAPRAYVHTVKWHWQNKQIKAKKPLATSVKQVLADNKADQYDPVNRPAHYLDGGVETIDFIEAKGLDYHLGNAVKYLSRAGKKTLDEREDLQKAIWYINRRLDTLGK